MKYHANGVTLRWFKIPNKCCPSFHDEYTSGCWKIYHICESCCVMRNLHLSNWNHKYFRVVDCCKHKVIVIVINRHEMCALHELQKIIFLWNMMFDCLMIEVLDNYIYLENTVFFYQDYRILHKGFPFRILSFNPYCGWICQIDL